MRTRHCRRCRLPYPDDGEALCPDCANVVIEGQLAQLRHRRPEPAVEYPSWAVCSRCGGVQGRHATDCEVAA